MGNAIAELYEYGGLRLQMIDMISYFYHSLFYILSRIPFAVPDLSSRQRENLGNGVEAWAMGYLQL